MGAISLHAEAVLGPPIYTTTQRSLNLRSPGAGARCNLLPNN